ncbi:MAG TPA: AAA family ATPase [Candidatus Angelobacter sp.]|nr:AAA family ATPase [Candidatus Angelobacter sp.]
MKLLGVEFFDFACFERQFIKLPDGLVLLVGKNNAGKTAILRGLALLASLPIGNQKPWASSVVPYCRKQQPQPHYDFHLIFSAEHDDFPLFCDADSAWTSQMVQQKPYFRFIFRIWPNQGLIAWVSINFHVGVHEQDTATILVDISNSGPVLRHYAAAYDQGLPTLGNMTGHHGVQHTGSLIQTPDGLHTAVLVSTAPLMGAAAELTQTKLVSAHRVPHPQMSLQSTVELPTDASTLAGYLQTLQNNDRSKFQKIEDFLRSVFPEVQYVNPSNRNNQVALTVIDKATSAEIPLTHCGTGIEQLLSLATFALTSPPGCMLLMDEPHSFLHPSAERKLVEFIHQNNKQHFVVSTHSPILINSVEADRIIYLQSPGSDFSVASAAVHERSRMLLELGYRNSDVLFNDRLIAVEGESDKEILRILLNNQEGIPSGEIDRTGFPVMEGAGEGARALQTAVLRFEKLLDAIGRAKQPRVYLFDGDKSQEDQSLLQGTTYSDSTVPIVFLPRNEIENYLLYPLEITEALRHQAALDEITLPAFTAETVKQELTDLLSSNDSKIFPNGNNGDPFRICKGSRVLERLFNKFGNQRYEKRRSGVMLANLVKSGSHKEIREIVEKVKPAFR